MTVPITCVSYDTIRDRNNVTVSVQEQEHRCYIYFDPLALMRTLIPFQGGHKKGAYMFDRFQRGFTLFTLLALCFRL